MPQTAAPPAARERLVVMIPAEVKQSLRIAAAKENRDQQEVVAEAITEYIERHNL